MRMVKRHLAADENVVTVWFNAWRYEQEEHPIVPLVGTIVRALEVHTGLNQRFGDAGGRLIRSLRVIAYGFSAKSKVQMPGFAEFEASFVAKDMIDRNANLTADPLLDRSLYFGAFERLDTVKLRADLRVIVLVDDLDRCFPDQAIRLLESIKLVLAQPGFIFVLGVARKVVEGYLRHRYSEYGIADFKGELYLDKIVQLPFHIPPSTNRMTQFCRTLLVDQPADLVAELQTVLPSVADALGGNPRAVIRFINNILVDHAISTTLSESEGSPVIPIRYFAVSRCLEHRWPDVFDALTTSDDLPDEVVNWAPETYAAKALGSGTDSLVASKLVSDPELRQLLTGAQGRDWLTNSVLRRASVSFLVTRQRLSKLDTSEVRIRYDAFVSFANDDRPIVVEIVEQLVTAGVRVFFDGHIPLGADWKQTLDISLSSADTLLYCVGKTTGAATGQLREYDAMARRSDISIIPVLLPGVDTETLPDTLRMRQWLDFRAGVTASGMQKLISALRSKNRRT